VIAQHAAKAELAKSYGNLQRSRVVKQGDNALTFYIDEAGRTLKMVGRSSAGFLNDKRE
jgi:hypothetical protein